MCLLRDAFARSHGRISCWFSFYASRFSLNVPAFLVLCVLRNSLAFISSDLSGDAACRGCVDRPRRPSDWCACAPCGSLVVGTCADDGSCSIAACKFFHHPSGRGFYLCRCTTR